MERRARPDRISPYDRQAVGRGLRGWVFQRTRTDSLQTLHFRYISARAPRPAYSAYSMKKLLFIIAFVTTLAAPTASAYAVTFYTDPGTNPTFTATPAKTTAPTT